MDIEMAAKPADWPHDGPIDLSIHDLPHQSSTTEWWYVNSHLETETGRKFALFASFFRLATGENKATKEVEYAHSVTWAVSDLDNEKYHVAACIDPRAPEILLDELDHDEDVDSLLSRAMREVLNRHTLPHPDRLITKPITVNLRHLELNYGGDRFYKDAAGVYHLDLLDDMAQTGCELTFLPLKPPVRHGDNGVVRGVSNEKMFYYFIPRCRVEGHLIVNGERHPVKTASGWYDHEFGQQRFTDPQAENSIEGDAALSEEHTAWNWISVQLDNGWEVAAYDIFNTKRGENAGRWAMIIDPSGNQQLYREFSFEPLSYWTSVRTFSDYPTRWRLEIPEVGLWIEADAAFFGQEFITLISPPAFWEGRINCIGSMQEQPIHGCGYVERSGYASREKIEDFFAAVGRMTRRTVQQLLPLEPDNQDALHLIASSRNPHYIDGIDIDQYARTVIKPLREIVDRGGKAWRSYACVACCEVVGGDASRLAHWLAMPELFHVGSLIVDDVQDKSDLRRGGTAAHRLYGEALAINAGTAAYFLGQLVMSTTRLTGAQQLRIYELYFETLRATHAGQALDIDGLGTLMPHVVESGAGELLEKRVMAIHRLKSAVPARALAMIGAVLGQGTEAQINALGDFFEALGLAFQIIDDVLNLRGFKGDLKSKGEDLAQGKVTMPVAKAMSRLPLETRREVWATMSARPTNPMVIGAIIETFDRCCALRSCEEHARDLVEAAWQALDPVIEDSFVKIRLRAFGWYVLERHY